MGVCTNLKLYKWYEIAQSITFKPFEINGIICMRWVEETTKNSTEFRANQGSTNWMHGDERTRNGHVEVFACRKLRARKSIKTPLSNTPMLLKVASCFCLEANNICVNKI